MCVFVCMCVYLFIFPHPREQTFYLKFESMKAACIQTIKAKQSLLLHLRTGKHYLEGMFLSQSKTRRSDHPQTSRFAFPVDFSGVLPKNSILGLMGITKMRNSSFGKCSTYTNENEEQFGSRLCWKNFKRITR